MKKLSFVALILTAFTLQGCAVVNAENEMEQSLAAYKQCLKLNPQKISECDAQKAIYEADISRLEQLIKATY